MEALDFKRNLEKYVQIALVRKWWIIIPFLLTLLAGLTYALATPGIYKGETLILVIQQKVPENYVRSIVQMNMEERLRTIQQQVTSRTNLENLIEQYQVFSSPSESKMALQTKVELFKKRILINVARGTAFTISYIDKNQKKAKDVTNGLASNFISENLRIREEQAIGTSNFLADEVLSVKKRLEEKEELLKQYQQRFMGAMPENLSTNLSILGRLQNQLEQLNSNLSAAEDRKLIIQQQISNAEMMKKQMGVPGMTDSLVEVEAFEGSQFGDSDEALSLRNKLTLLESRYTANHPDVIRVKEMIARIEAQQAESTVDQGDLGAESSESELEPEIEPAFSMTDMLRPQLEQIDLEIKNHREEIQKIRSQVELYERRIEGTPEREQEMLSLNREYGNLRQLYDSLLARKLEAEIALSMEKKQKGEQFKIVDPAVLPERPFKPDIRKILLLSLFLGLGLGCGLAFLMETLDTSYKTPDEIEEELQMPVLVSMPIRYTKIELQSIKRKSILAYVSVGVAFVLSVAGILLTTRGVGKTLNYFKDLLFGL